MTSNIPNDAVAAVIEGRTPANKEGRLTQIEKELEKLRREAAEQERLDKRYATIQSAFAKLKRELFKTLTPEELAAIDGAYIFLHSGLVDLVRTVPSATSHGEDEALDRDMRTVEAKRAADSTSE